MPQENRGRISRIISLVIIIAAIAVIIGWIFDLSVLKSISPAWVSMKFDTALTFILSGVTLYFIAKAQAGDFDWAQVALAITSLIIMLLMGMLFLSALLDVHTGVEDLFIKEAAMTAKTVVPGRPSLPTMINFILIALAGIFSILNAEKLRIRLKIIGAIIAIIGTLAVAGYIFNAPRLYYFIAGVNSAMALHTAILFVLMGAGLLCL